MIDTDNFLWVEKYRPRKIADTILPKELKKTFQTFVDNGAIPNLILSGGAGMGKTTVARAMLEELGCDYIVINGSMNGNIDTLRNDILNFASTVSLTGGRKYVILDEADYLNPNSTQPALRNFMEEFSKNCGFILTCNFVNKIIEPLHSRCSIVEFKIPEKEAPVMAATFFARVVDILKKESIEYNDKVVIELVKKHFPDFRRILNELQRYSATGKIDTGIFVQDVTIDEIIGFVKDKNVSAMRKWAAENAANVNDVFRKFYDQACEGLEPASKAQLIMSIADYQYKSAFVVDQEINLAAFLVEVAINVDWK